MKRLNYILTALITMFLVVGCSNEEQLPVVNDSDKALVAFNLDLPEDGLQTRAIGDGAKVNQLVYQVFEVVDDQLEAITENSVSVDAFAGESLETSLQLKLLQGRIYKVAFWAQVKGKDYYSTDDLRKLTVNYNGTNNDDARDAFFGSHEIAVEGDERVDVVLRRPFAQLNAGAGDYDAKITHSSVFLEDVANEIDLLTGETKGSVNVNYTNALLPDDPNVLTVDGEHYRYLSMSYILVGNQKEALRSVKYTFSENGANPIVVPGLTNVPVQRNNRTNIVGNLLTSDIDYDISIDTGGGDAGGGDTGDEEPFDVDLILTGLKDEFTNFWNDRVKITVVGRAH